MTRLVSCGGDVHCDSRGLYRVRRTCVSCRNYSCCKVIYFDTLGANDTKRFAIMTHISMKKAFRLV